ncbi:unnamed protein product [Diamesa hyperborea]
MVFVIRPKQINPKCCIFLILTWLFLTLTIFLFVFSPVNNYFNSFKVIGKVDRDFSWMRKSRNLSIYVRPNEDTALLVPTNINKIIQRNKITCFVLSAPNNRNARSAIRRTWGKIMKPIFLTGLSDNKSMTFLHNEAKVFNDIIIEDFHDSYQNLTLKVAFLLKNYLRHFPDSQYFFKLDDDVFLNVKLLKNKLRDENYPRHGLIGRRMDNYKPHRDQENKFYIPHWLYGKEKLPSYIDGPAYLIPSVKARKMYEAAMDVPLLNLEDVYFTGLVANNHLGFYLDHEKRFIGGKALFLFHPCFYQ